MIALYVIHQLKVMFGESEMSRKINLVELGPGTGALAHSVLHVCFRFTSVLIARHSPNFHQYAAAFRSVFLLSRVAG